MAIDHAKQAYDRLGHSHLSSAHLVLGLLSLNGGVGDTVLKRAGLSAEFVERYLSTKHTATEEIVEREGASFGRSAANALARAESDATSFNYTILGVEHLTIALLTEERGEAADLFVSSHIEREKLKQTILDQIR